MAIKRITASCIKIDGRTMGGESTEINERLVCMLAVVRNAMAVQGDRALENPRSSALVHEAGHSVVYTHFGIDVQRCQIWQVGTGSDDWGGFTTTGRMWQSDGLSAPEEDLREAICLMAGVNAEKFFDPLNFRLASSADEIAQCCSLAFNVAVKLRCEQDTVLEHIDRLTTEILVENKSIVSNVAAVLDEKQKVWGKPLAALLTGVTRGNLSSLAAPLKRSWLN